MTAVLTSSPRTVRVGAQRPSVLSGPPFERSLGGECADFMADVGRPGLPWQRDALVPMLGLRPDGRWAAYEVALWLARQNGKGWVTEALELFGAFMLREKTIIHSAHLFDTSQKAFNRTIEVVEGSDWLRKRTAKITRGKGFEAIHVLPQFGGGSIEFKARTLHGSRGLTGERVTLDEAYALTTGHYQAMSPVMATLPNPQIVYTSSPPDESTGMMPADALAPSIRARGLAGAPALAMLSWEPPPGFAPSDVDVWYACNPSLGDEEAIAQGLALIDEEFLRRQWDVFRQSPRPMAFATEHLGLWPELGGARWVVVPEQAWLDASWSDMPRPEPVAFSVTVSEDQSWGAICAAGRVGTRDDGRPLYGVIVVDRRPGLGWLVDRLFELADKWEPVITICDRNSPANEVWAEVENRNLERAGSASLKALELTPISPRDVAAAAAGLYTGVAGPPTPDEVTGEPLDPRNVKHRDQGVLTTAIAGAQKKSTASGAWHFDSTTDPIAKGVADALWGFKSRPEPVAEPWAFSM